MSTANATAARPLAGLRVIDITTVMLGPYATQILGDYGADVIKVEAPGGDSTRSTGPSPERGMAATFLGANRSKRSVVLDLKQEAGREALLTLVDTADVLVCSVRPQKMRALGLAPEVLRERVTSKGGTTYAALTSMQQDQVPAAFIQAMHAACLRAGELGDVSGKA